MRQRELLVVGLRCFLPCFMHTDSGCPPSVPLSFALGLSFHITSAHYLHSLSSVVGLSISFGLSCAA